MDGPVTIPLPGPALAAASDGTTVWCAAAGLLTAYDPYGTPLRSVPLDATDDLTGLAAAPGLLACAYGAGTVRWLDPVTGQPIGGLPFGGSLEIVAGATRGGTGGVLWVVDRNSDRVWRASEPGVVSEPLTLPALDGYVPDDERLWWTARDDTFLRGGSTIVDLKTGASARGGMAVCAGSVWIGARGALLRVGAWAAVPGPPLPLPPPPDPPGSPVPPQASPAPPSGSPASVSGSPVPPPTSPVPPADSPVPLSASSSGERVALLACVGGVLVGWPWRGGLFELNVTADTAPRPLAADPLGPLSRLVSTNRTVWAMSADRATAQVIPLRPR
ncbi:hypothetical protein [Streptosporangium sp. NPDC051022]|uniref:hypothetical protein n=1 Tax=Streptosporangium sp. NPDC051022 TaxID=3155752 RepID=UPI0034262966